MNQAPACWYEEPADAGAIGIKNIYSRIELLSGRIEIKAVQNDCELAGTLVTISLPYKPVTTDKEMNY